MSFSPAEIIMQGRKTRTLGNKRATCLHLMTFCFNSESSLVLTKLEALKLNRVGSYIIAHPS